MKSTKSNEHGQEFEATESSIDEFFKSVKIASLLDSCGIRKRNGYSVTSVLRAIFALPFVGKNFYRGIVLKESAHIGKDPAYDFLSATTYNWRRLLLRLFLLIYNLIKPLTDADRDDVIIADDSTYERSRAKNVELVSRVYDHSSGKFIRGYRMLTLCWSDGASCLPLDFALLSSSKPKNRYQESVKKLDKRCCAYKRRQEAKNKATDQLVDMVRRNHKAGVSAKYLLMDRWFTSPSVITKLKEYIDVIGMVKKSSKIHYIHEGVTRDLNAIYRNIRKRPGKAKILGSALVELKTGVAAKIVFVRDHRNKGWLAVLSTDTGRAEEDIVKIYGKRWDIEVFFQMAKQHLKLAKEIQVRDYDSLIAHTTIVFMRHLFIAYRVRMETDHRSFGDLFRACCEEVKDIDFMEAIYRILTLAIEALEDGTRYCRKTAQRFINAIIETAFNQTSLSKSGLICGLS
jgi:hypothetical protein